MLENSAFTWVAQERYFELMNFDMELFNILQSNVYELSEEEKVPVIKYWLGQEGLQLIQTFT